jgi:hypothetical protein
MKKIVLILLTGSMLMSCNRWVNVKLTNGAILKCYNESHIDFPELTQVCIYNRGYNWYICYYGEMKDTTIQRKSWPIKHRIGKVTKLY